ncbi:MAG: nuclear transport factor 2 family protein [Acidobacteriota bacterium]|nr:nuclear transport factor 2 family protein [Acidobacteriota bacterium]
MIRTLITAVVVMAAFSLTLGQTTDKKTTGGSGDEQAVQKFMDEFTAALGRNDTAALERMYADDWSFVNPNGVLVTKAQALANMKSGTLKYESLSIDERNVRIYGNTAVMTGRATVKGQRDGQDIAGQYRATSVLVKKGGNWQVVAQQSTRIAQQ